MRFLLLLLVVGCIDNTVKEVQETPDEAHKLLMVAPSEVDYGISSTNAPIAQAVTLTADGASPVTISSLTVTGSTAFTLTWPDGDVVLQPSQSTEVVVTYIPTTAADAGTLVVTSDAETPVQTVPLTGGGTFPQIEVSPSVVYIDSPYPGSQAALVHVRSVGSSDLHIDSMLVQGDPFSATGPIPIVLAPGAETDLTVVYTPRGEGDASSGQLWLTTNTAIGYTMVPLEGEVPPECIGLGEAWDRGLLTVMLGGFGGELILHNLGGDDDICIDRWYMYLSDGSQDAAAGDPNYDPNTEYPDGTLNLLTNSAVGFDYANPSNPAWWCVEHTQYTAGAESYEFTGAHVPDPLLAAMLAGDQDAVWAYQENNPVVLVGRETNYVELAGAGASAEVTLWTSNIGEVAISPQVYETIPAGFSASGFAPAPISTVVHGDGSTTLGFATTLAGRVASETGADTEYARGVVTYTLTMDEPCIGRVPAPEAQATWVDSSGDTYTSTANPLVIRCL